MYQHGTAEVVSTYEEKAWYSDRECQWLVSNQLTTAKKLITVKDEEEACKLSYRTKGAKVFLC